MVRSPLISSTGLNYDSQIQNTKWRSLHEARRTQAGAGLSCSHIRSGSTSLAQYANFLHLHLKYTSRKNENTSLKRTIFAYADNRKEHELSVSPTAVKGKIIGSYSSNTSLQSFLMLTTVHPYSWASSKDFSAPAT